MFTSSKSAAARVAAAGAGRAGGAGSAGGGGAGAGVALLKTIIRDICNLISAVAIMPCWLESRVSSRATPSHAAPRRRPLPLPRIVRAHVR